MSPSSCSGLKYWAIQMKAQKIEPTRRVDLLGDVLIEELRCFRDKRFSNLDILETLHSGSEHARQLISDSLTALKDELRMGSYLSVWSDQKRGMSAVN